MPNTAAPRIEGARIGVLLEHKFIAEEIFAYLHGFPLLGAEVILLTRLPHDHRDLVFYSDVDPLDSPPWETPRSVRVEHDFRDSSAGDFAAIIMSANYTSIRLRYNTELPAPDTPFDPRSHVADAPAVQFFARAMQNPDVIKGALCHGLWLLTPVPQLLRGRKVICHSVVMSDVLNCGAEIIVNAERIVRDGDLVTGFSRHEVLPFMAAIAEGIAAQRAGRVHAAAPPVRAHAV